MKKSHTLSTNKFSIVLKKLLPFTFFIIALKLNAQEWQWIKTAYGTGSETVNASTTDSQGNLYVLGEFNDSTVLSENITFYHSPGSPYSYQDFFFAKYDTAGNVVWAQNYGNGAYLSYIVYDGYGSIYLAGTFYEDSITFGTYILVKDSNQSSKMFLAKFDTDGNIIWTIQAGADSKETLGICSVDELGNLYISGNFHSPTLTLGTITLYNSGVFFAKLDPAGNFIWAKGIAPLPTNSSASWVGGNGVSDRSGNFYFGGYFSDSILIIEGDTFPGLNGSGGMFFAKYDSTGNFQWAKINDRHAHINALKTDKQGNLIMAGFFNSPSLTFDSIILEGPPSTEGRKSFIAKYTSNGILQWAINSCNSYADLSTDNAGNIYLAGTYDWNIIIGDDTLNKTNKKTESYTEKQGQLLLMEEIPEYDVFLVSLDANGNVRFARSASGNGDDRIYTISIDDLDHLYVGGFFASDTLKFGNTALTNSFVGEYTNRDMFIAMMNIDSNYDEDTSYIQAYFSSDKNKICAGDSISFLDSSFGEITSLQWTFEGGTPSVSSQLNPVVMYLQPGIFSVKLLVFNSEKSDSLILIDGITVNSLPEIYLGEDTVITGQTYLLDAQVYFEQYLWNTGDTVAAITINENGYYSVSVTDQNGCSAFDEINILFDTISVAQNTVLAKNFNNPSLFVYPSPAKGKINVAYQLKTSSEIIFSVSDSRGILIYMDSKIEKPGLTIKSIDLNDYSRGIYYLNLNVGVQNETRKIVVE